MLGVTVAAVRYRYHGKFISEGTARRYANLKGAAPFVTSERVKIGGHTVTARKAGYVPPADLQRKRPPSPPAPPTAPTPGPLPAAAPVPPLPPPGATAGKPAKAPVPAQERPRRERQRISPEERFDRDVDQWKDLADSFEEEPSRELWDEIVRGKADLDERFEGLEDPGESTVEKYESVEYQYEDLRDTLAPGEYDYDLDLFGYDRFEGEDQFIEDMEILDLDTDEEYPEK